MILVVSYPGEDDPAPVVACSTLTGVSIEPGMAIPFGRDAPMTGRGQAFSLRVRINLTGAPVAQREDLLTTQNIPIVNDILPLVVSLEKIR